MTGPDSTRSAPSRTLYPYGGGGDSGANLADILERVLDKGIVIVGDIKINLLDIELLTVKLRLLVASVDKAKEIGIDWWEHDPALSSRADERRELRADERRELDQRRELEDENARLRGQVKALRRRVREADTELPPAERRRSDTDGRPEAARRRTRSTAESDDDERER
ncbi:gas vesicle protein GvpJ [Streptomyces sp. NPDC046805]|uniref:gas vesicle protein n=1 Tax=Streptomyces sp. NPDC046805 TaxID=3155134 RepID=UPI0034014E4B